MVIYLALLQEPPFLALFGLRALLVVAPLDGVAHGRHGGLGLGCVVLGLFGEAVRLWKFWQEAYR